MMIERIYTKKDAPVIASTTTLFRLVALLTILGQDGDVKISKIQVLLWGVSNDMNASQILEWKERGVITDAPFATDYDIFPLLSQCVENHYINIMRNPNGHFKSYEIASLGSSFLSSIDNFDVTIEIKKRLNRIGNITYALIKKMTFDF